MLERRRSCILHPRHRLDLARVARLQHQIVKELERRLTICRVDWGLPLLQADVGVLGLPPSFPVVPQYLGHTSVVPQPLTEPDKQLSHIRLFTQTFGSGKTGSCRPEHEDSANQHVARRDESHPTYTICVDYADSAI